MLTLKLGNATINARIGTQDYGGEFPGECEWSLDARQLRAIFARFPNLEYSGMISEAIGDAIERIGDGETEDLESMQDEETISIRDADSGILLLRAMAEIGGEWSIDWQGENATWFFHDWDHAEHDCRIQGSAPEIDKISDAAEERAQVNGARAALMHGIPIDDVVEAVVSILDEFERRFGYRPQLMARIFKGCRALIDV